MKEVLDRSSQGLCGIGMKDETSSDGKASAAGLQGVKKTQAEKALAALAEAGKVTCKEFGKTKIYAPVQEGLAELTAEVRAGNGHGV